MTLLGQISMANDGLDFGQPCLILKINVFTSKHASSFGKLVAALKFKDLCIWSTYLYTQQKKTCNKYNKSL